MINEDPLPSIPSESANSDPIGTASDAATKVWETTRQKAGEAIETGERYVRDHPGTSVLSIFGLGVALGFVVGWSVAKEDDYTTSARKCAKRWGYKLNLD
jgi:hypothetical protein